MSPAYRVMLAVACAFACAAPLRAQDLKLVIADGKVTLLATDVPARQILNEWARIGQTRIINAEKLPPTILTLKLEGVPEGQALDIILRGASGYMAAPRVDASAGSSVFDRIMIMPTSTVVASASAPRPVTSTPTPPTFVRPPPFPGATAPDDQDAPVPQPGNVGVPNSALAPGMPGYIAPPPVPQPGVVPQYPGAPVTVTLPNGQTVQQPAPQYPYPAPGGSVPGMISPPPGVPQMPGVINPLAPKKPGG